MSSNSTRDDYVCVNNLIFLTSGALLVKPKRVNQSMQTDFVVERKYTLKQYCFVWSEMHCVSVLIINYLK